MAQAFVPVFHEVRRGGRSSGLEEELPGVRAPLPKGGRIYEKGDLLTALYTWRRWLVRTCQKLVRTCQKRDTGLLARSGGEHAQAWDPSRPARSRGGCSVAGARPSYLTARLMAQRHSVIGGLPRVPHGLRMSAKVLGCEFAYGCPPQKQTVRSWSEACQELGRTLARLVRSLLGRPNVLTALSQASLTGG